MTIYIETIIFITVLYNAVINGLEENVTKPIEGVYERIVSSAKEEFLEKGYSDASLRTIATKAGTTTGSIYSRFGGKEGLFSAIVEPTAQQVINMFVNTQEEFHAVDPDMQPQLMGKYVHSGMLEILEYIYDNFEEFQLLLDSSYGTKFQDFEEKLVEIETEYTYKYMEAINLEKERCEMITEDFIHIMTRAMFESMFEVVRHKMPKDIAVKYMKMLERYHYAGWDTIMKFSE